MSERTLDWWREHALTLRRVLFNIVVSEPSGCYRVDDGWRCAHCGLLTRLGDGLPRHEDWCAITVARLALSGSPRPESPPLDALPGNRVVRVGPVGIGAIAPDARDLLDRIMAAWEPDLASMVANNPPDFAPSPYLAFYWLCRWSGLIDPTAAMDRLDTLVGEAWEEGVPS